ncbi:MAG: HNH endonuclease, partial [Firmicutes bacterium]|nr:HNH endonuclease [Bacillota bacterium]
NEHIRSKDNQWTFGKPNDKTGYMEIAGERVHRIVATAFFDEPPNKDYVVDHIDTNRRNNRPENLRWVTKFENIFLNPITRKKIEYICGCSTEMILNDITILQKKINLTQEFSWMRIVNEEEAQASKERLLSWAKSDKKPSGGTMGEWVFTQQKELATEEQQEQAVSVSMSDQEQYAFGNEKSELLEMISNEADGSKRAETIEKLLRVCEPTISTFHRRKHAQVVCPVSRNGECGVLDCIYCKYHFEADEREICGCFGKSGIRTYEDLLSVIDVQRKDEQIISITYDKGEKQETKKFEYYDADAFGKTLFELWDERNGDKVIAHSIVSEWYALIEENPREALVAKGSVYARLSRNIEDLPNNTVRTIFGYENKEWKEVKEE